MENKTLQKPSIWREMGSPFPPFPFRLLIFFINIALKVSNFLWMALHNKSIITSVHDDIANI